MKLKNDVDEAFVLIGCGLLVGGLGFMFNIPLFVGIGAGAFLCLVMDEKYWS